MDGLEFASRLIEHGAWPAIAIYVAVTQKNGIRALLSRMSKFKAPGMEAEFDTKAEKAAEKIDERAAKPVEPPKVEQKTLAHVIQEQHGLQASTLKQRIDELMNSGEVALEKAKRDQHQRSERLRDERLRASGLIIEEWANLEDTIRVLAAGKGFIDAGKMAVPRLLNELRKLGMMSEATSDSVMDLKKLRDQVAHTKIEPTREAGENFATSCWKVERRIAEEEAAWQRVAQDMANEMLAELEKQTIMPK